jgi:aminoacyl tRNA synthase complex-interacting multifunctional protein 1
LGCGMVDPAVLEKAGIDPQKYAGFAAGFGVERFAMVIHGIPDIREFFKNDVRFLDQFPHFYDEGMYAFLQGEDFEKDRVWPPVDPDYVNDDEFTDDELKEIKAKYSHLWLEWEQQFGGSGDEANAVNGDKGLVVQDGRSSKTKQGTDRSDKGSDSNDVIDISKLDIRIGIIQKAWFHPESDKLFCEEIDIGENQVRQIASGLRAHYQLDDLVGQRVLVVANLKPRKIAGFISYGMVLCAANESKVKLITPPDGAPVGESVTVEGYIGEPATENQIIKKKMIDVIFPDLRTDEAGVAKYKNIPLSTSAGVCVAQDNMPNSQVS